MPKGAAEFAEHVQTRKDHPPPVLYKYTTAATARLILSSGTLRFQSPLRYNDPFDAQWEIHWPLFTKGARRFERDLFRRALLDPKCWPKQADRKLKKKNDHDRARILRLPKAERAEEIERVVRTNASDAEMRTNINRRLSEIRQRLRLLCLCEDDLSMLMWPHYADQHRGVVLGFDTQRLEQGWQRPLLRVKYVDELPCLLDSKKWSTALVFGLPTPEFDFNEWPLTKHSGWSYEREWRFVGLADKSKLGLFQDTWFSRNSLVEVIEGCKTDTATSIELLALARAINPDVKHYRLSKHPRRFELVKQTEEDHWAV